MISGLISEKLSAEYILWCAVNGFYREYEMLEIFPNVILLSEYL